MLFSKDVTKLAKLLLLFISLSYSYFFYYYPPRRLRQKNIKFPAYYVLYAWVWREAGTEGGRDRGRKIGRRRQGRIARREGEGEGAV